MTRDLNPKFDAMRNAIYHTSRRRFFELLTRCLSFLVVASGTAAVANIHAIDPRYAAAGAAMIGALQLVFDFSGRARTHEILQRKYYDLLAEIDGIQTPNDEQFLKWQAALNRIYADEPPPMRALDAIAYNAACRNMGYDNSRKHVNMLQLALSQILQHNHPYHQPPQTNTREETIINTQRAVTGSELQGSSQVPQRLLTTRSAR
jgi:hypothetical protein